MTSGAGSYKAAGAPPKIGFWFGLGLVFLPWLFCWFLLGRPYSNATRAIGIGWAAFTLVLSQYMPKTEPPPTPDPVQQSKDTAAAMARMVVTRSMKDPSSAKFGTVWGIGPNIACGSVNGRNGFGAMAGDQGFIFVGGQVEFDDGSQRFVRHWNSICIDKLLTAAPTGVDGLRWGGRPTSEYRPYAPPTDGLALYVRKDGVALFVGVPVKEEDYRFDHGRFFAADYYIDGDANRDAAKAVLVKKYGNPLTSDDSAHSYQWNWPNLHTSIEMTYEEKTARTQVTFGHGVH